MRKKINMVPVPKLKKLIQGTGTEIIQLNKAFTLVELIVVITILAILATIGFVSFSGYLAGTRDTNRIAQLKSMSDALELYRTKKDLPIPDDKIDIKTSTKTIAYQGYIGKNVLETIEYTESGLDPKDKNYFSYYLTKNKKYFQLLSFLEEPNTDVVSLNNKVPVPILKKGIPGTGTEEVLATDYSERYPKTTGKKLGILTDDNNTPIQEIPAISNSNGNTGSGYLNINNVGTTVYKSIISNDEIITGSGITLAGTNPIGSCKRIKQLKGSSDDGFYTIDPEGNGTGFKVYCDMTTDGGGWTSLVRFNPSENNSIYWNTPKVEGDFYNILDKKDSFIVNEIYVNKVVGYDGGEYVFEKIGNDLYARRGILKDVMIKENWSGLVNSTTYTLNNWIGFYYGNTGNGFNYNGTEYRYIGHNNTSNPSPNIRYDFPFYQSLNTQYNGALSDNPWGSAYNYTDDVIVNIFVR